MFRTFYAQNKLTLMYLTLQKKTYVDKVMYFKLDRETGKVHGI
jgi:hypothetical protein